MKTHVWLLAVVTLFCAGKVLPAQQNASGESGSARHANVEARTVDVEMVEPGQLRLVLEADTLPFVSPYGELAIPVAEIEAITFATRHSAEKQKQIDGLIFELGSRDFAAREKAERKLLALGAKGHGALVRTTKHPDLEVAQRAQALVQQLAAQLTPEELEVREFDVITTTHSTLAGHIKLEALPVQTTQFGAQTLRLADLRSLHSSAIARPVEEPAEVLPDPGSLTGLRDQIGKTFAFKVTGSADRSIWGTETYTADSGLATAAVHMGVLKIGETGIVRVTIVPPPPTFAGTTQNGLTSSSYGSYPGAYKVITAKKPVARGRGRGLVREEEVIILPVVPSPAALPR
jgi:hypothetical protein